MAKKNNRTLSIDSDWLSILRQSPDGIALFAMPGFKLLDANPIFLKIAGRNSADEITDKNLLDIFQEQAGEKEANRLRALIQTSSDSARLWFPVSITLRSQASSWEISLYSLKSDDGNRGYVVVREITEQDRLASQLNRRLEEVELFNRILDKANSSSDPHAVFTLICSELGRSLNLDSAELMILDYASSSIHFIAEFTRSKQPLMLGKQIRISRDDNEALGKWIRLPRAIQLSEFPQMIDNYPDLYGDKSVVSMLVVPLLVRDELIGLIRLGSRIQRDFTRDEIQLAANSALAAAQSFDVARSRAELETELSERIKAQEALRLREEYLETVIHAQNVIMSGSDRHEVLPYALSILAGAVEANQAYILRYRSNLLGANVLRIYARWVSGKETAAFGDEILQYPAVENFFYRAASYINEGQTFLVKEAALTGELKNVLVLKNIKSVLVLPLLIQSGLDGYLIFTFENDREDFGHTLLSLIMVGAASVSMALERNDVLDALVASDERYRLVFEHAQDVIFQMDLTGRLTFLNPSWETIMKIPVAASVGLPFWKVVPVDALPTFQTCFRILREHLSDRYQQVIKIENQRDTPLWLELNARLVDNPEDGSPLISGTLVDITLMKSIEVQLKNNEVTLRQLYDITSHQDWPLEEKIDRILLLGNEVLNMETGGINQVAGDELVHLNHMRGDGLPFSPQPKVIPLRTAFSRELIKAGEAIGLEHVGASDWAEIETFRAMKIESLIGCPIHIGMSTFGTLVFHSTQPRQRRFTAAEKELTRLMAQWIGAEMERSQYANQLSQAVTELEERSADLAIARDQALEASRMKSDFLATMSHEIRTPLNAVIGMTELLMDTDLTKQQTQYARIIQESGKSLLVVINDILDYSRMEAGKLDLKVGPIDLLRLVEGVVDMFLQEAHSRLLRIHSYVSPAIPRYLMGDGDRLRQVLLNLVGNAVKFTDQGEILVRVLGEYTAPDEVQVTVKVTDTGNGIPAALREHLFQPFTQADQSASRRFGGTGLGLAISKRLISQMGGTIGVNSEVGRGSTFWFRLPMPVAVDAGLLEQIEEAPIKRPLENMHVLVADSNRAQRRIVLSYIRSWNGIADDARAEEQVLQKIQAEKEAGTPYQLLIWGFETPEIPADIREVLEDTKVIFLTSLEDAEGLPPESADESTRRIIRPVKQSTLFDGVAALFFPQTIPDTNSLIEPQAKPVQQKTENLIVLLAEDNLSNQMLATAQLNLLGCRVETAADGRQAVERYQQAAERYDLILMDCQMPAMDGYAATREIRELEKETGRHVRIIAMTANALEGDRETCLAAGMDDYISKPVSLDRLREALSQIPVKPARSEPKKGDEKALDEKMLSEIRGLGDEGDGFLRNLIEVFLSDAQSQMDEVSRAVEAGDLVVVKEIAHRLKGSSSSLSAIAFSKVCLSMEMAARDGQLSEVKEIHAQLLEKFAEMRQAMLDLPEFN